MTNTTVTSPIPPTSNDLPLSTPETSQGSRLARIVTVLCKPLPVCDLADVEFFAHSFETPRYSTAYLSKVNLTIIERDNKITRIEQQHKKTLAVTKPIQQQRNSPAQCAIRPLSRWYAGISDPKVAALYKSTLQYIKRLTRGRR